MFSKDEESFMLAAIDAAVKVGGLNTAGLGITCAMKIQKLRDTPPALAAVTETPPERDEYG